MYRPSLEKIQIDLITTNSGLQASSVGMQGWRMSMEDSHHMCDLSSFEGHSFFAIFDGHGGIEAAKYSAEKIVNIFENTSEWKLYVKENNIENVKMIPDIFTKTFLELDVQLLNQQTSNITSHDTSGCTAICVLITPKYYVCANVGDCRCVLGAGPRAIYNLSEDHKPYQIHERKRIEAAGGEVVNDRIDGQLAVSRALGDFSYKIPPEFEPKDQKLTCCPDVCIHERTELDDVIVLACDGFWDVLSSSEAIKFARDIFLSGEMDMQLVAEELIDTAFGKGSKDNISVTVIQLPGAIIGDASKGGVRARRLKREKQSLWIRCFFPCFHFHLV